MPDRLTDGQTGSKGSYTSNINIVDQTLTQLDLGEARPFVLFQGTPYLDT